MSENQNTSEGKIPEKESENKDPVLPLVTEEKPISPATSSSTINPYRKWKFINTGMYTKK